MTGPAPTSRPLLDRLVALGLVSVRGPGDLRFRLLDVVATSPPSRLVDTG